MLKSKVVGEVVLESEVGGRMTGKSKDRQEDFQKEVSFLGVLSE